MKAKIIGGLVLALALLAAPLVADGYRDHAAVKAALERWEGEHPDLVKIISIGKSTGGLEIWVARVAAAGAVEPDKRPAVFLGGNIEGTRLLGTEAALEVIEYLISKSGEDEIAGLLKTRTFYIAPLMNPDVAQMAFSSPKWERETNIRPVNDDRDLATDEDGPADINGDGFITQIRLKSPDGEYIADPDDPRLMRKADRMKGERGEYQVMTEGIDDDGDGEINEDPQGGVVINRNFAHDFQYYSPGAGLYPVSEPETIAFLEFFINHRNIALIYTFGGQNNLLNLQRGKGPATIGAEKVKVPKEAAEFIGADPEQEYTIKEIVEMVKTLPFARGMDITEEMVAGFFGLGPIMSIPDDDYPYFEEISKRYKEMIKAKQIDDESRQAEAATGDGCFPAWAYYQYGVPAFTVDLWAVPKPKPEKKEGEEASGSGITIAKLKEMTPEEFLAFGEEKIALFLKEIKAPEQYNAKMVMGGVKGGMITPQKMAEMIEKMGGGAAEEKKEGEAKETYILKWAEENVEGGGFIPWTEFNHPTLGKVEIGGMKPFLKIVPPYAIGEKVLEPNAEFAVKLAKDLAQIEITGVSVKALDSEVYEITAFVRNNGYFPTALRQGVTTRQVPPVILKLGVDQTAIVGGQKVNRINAIPGNGVSQKYRWIVKGRKGTEIVLSASSIRCGSDSKTIVLQ
jgi:hypothetical protein